MNRRDLFPLGAAGLILPVLPAQTGAWKPTLFAAQQNETVIALTDLIIPATDTPGAKDAHVNRYLDLLLAGGKDEPKREFLAGLTWLDTHSRELHNKPFASLPADDQIEILKSLDTPATEDSLAPGRLFFRSIKSWTSRIYYATEIGFKELNKGGRVPATYGCPHPEQHA